jgi:hypothetical protein
MMGPIVGLDAGVKEKIDESQFFVAVTPRNQTVPSDFCFSVELAAEACTNHMYSDLERSKSGREEGEEARKLGAYSGAKCSIVEC